MPSAPVALVVVAAVAWFLEGQVNGRSAAASHCRLVDHDSKHELDDIIVSNTTASTSGLMAPPPLLQPALQLVTALLESCPSYWQPCPVAACAQHAFDATHPSAIHAVDWLGLDAFGFRGPSRVRLQVDELTLMNSRLRGSSWPDWSHGLMGDAYDVLREHSHCRRFPYSIGPGCLLLPGRHAAQTRFDAVVTDYLLSLDEELRSLSQAYSAVRAAAMESTAALRRYQARLLAADYDHIDFDHGEHGGSFQRVRDPQSLPQRQHVVHAQRTRFLVSLLFSAHFSAIAAFTDAKLAEIKSLSSSASTNPLPTYDDLSPILELDQRRTMLLSHLDDPLQTSAYRSYLSNWTQQYFQPTSNLTLSRNTPWCREEWYKVSYDWEEHWPCRKERVMSDFDTPPPQPVRLGPPGRTWYDSFIL